MTNSGLSRLISLEQLISLLVTVTVVGVAWGQISNKADNTDAKLKEAIIEQKVNRTNVNEINIKLELIKNDQLYMKRDIQETKDTLKEMLKFLKAQGK